MLAEKFELILFDLDDTLINTSRSYTEAQQESLTQHLPALKKSAAEWQAHRNQLQWFCKAFGSGNPEQYFKAFLQSIAYDASGDLVKKLVETYDALFWKKLAPLDHVTSLLTGLQSEKVKTAIVSNGKTANQQRKLEVTRLAPFFPPENLWISGDFESHQKKPSPFMILKALESFQVIPEKAAYIGNITADILAGNGAGMQTILFTDFIPTHQSVPRLAKPDYTLTQWDQPIVKYTH